MSDKALVKIHTELSREDAIRFASDLLRIIDNPEVEGVGLRIVGHSKHIPGSQFNVKYTPLGLKDRTEGQKKAQERS